MNKVTKQTLILIIIYSYKYLGNPFSIKHFHISHLLTSKFESSVCAIMYPDKIKMREEKLKNMKYRQLQKMAKEYGIKANLSNSSLTKELLEAFEKDKPSSKKYALVIAEAELLEQEALVRKTKRRSRGYNPTIWRELEAAELELESAKFKVETIKRKNHIEEIFWRFPHLGTQIFENLDNPSLANCREISTWWKKIVDSDKTFWIQQIQEQIAISNQSVKKTLRKENYETLQELARSSKKSMYRCKNKKKTNTFELLYNLLLECRISNETGFYCPVGKRDRSKVYSKAMSLLLKQLISDTRATS